MSWYRAGTVAVTSGSANVTLTGGNALANIFTDDGFIGPDGRTYAINTIGGAGSFTLQTNYLGATASGQAYQIVPTADYVQLRSALEQINTLITAYQDIAVKAGVGLFEPGSAAAPGVRGIGHTGTGLVWNDDDTLSISVAGTIVATFGGTGVNYWALPLIAAPAATDRVPIATSATTNGYSLRGSFVWRDAGGEYKMTETQFPRLIFERAGIGTWSLGYSGTPGDNGFSLRLNGGAPLIYAHTGGFFGVGTTAPAVKFHAKSIGEIARFETTTVRGSGGCFLQFFDPTGAKGFVGYSGGDDTFYITNNLTGTMALQTNGDMNFFVSGALSCFMTATSFRPGADNNKTLGHPSFRWSTVYAGTGTINTSDEREKTWRGGMTEAEYSAALRIIKELGFYQWNDAVAEKGKDARYHFGPRAQRVWSIMADEGLCDPIGKDGKPGRMPYAFMCWDEWEEQTQAIMAERTIKAKYKGRGAKRVEVEPERTERYDTGKTEVTIKAGNRYGVRTDQLIMFLIAAQDARLAALEERLNND